MSEPGKVQRRRRLWPTLGTVRRSSDRRSILTRRVAVAISLVVVIIDSFGGWQTTEKLCSIVLEDVPQPEEVGK